MPTVPRVKDVLFDNPTYLYLALALAEVALAAVWYERRGRRTAALLVVPVVLAGGLFALERAVVTDREWIAGAVEDIAADVARGRTAALERHLDERFVASFRGRDVGRAHALALARGQIRLWRVSGMSVRRMM